MHITKKLLFLINSVVIYAAESPSYIHQNELQKVTIDDVLHEIKNGNFLPTSLNKAFSKALALGEKGLIEALLIAGADANYNDGNGVPLDKVRQLSNIEMLLRHNADPKLCKESPIVNLLKYYMQRKNMAEGFFEWNIYFEKIIPKRMRRATKAMQSIKLLLQAGADVAQESKAVKPLRAVADWIKYFYLPLDQGKQIAKVLIAYGADSAQSDIDYDYYRYCPANPSQREVVAFEDYAYQERRWYLKCQKIRQLLIGAKDKNSILSTLPKDIVKEIGLWVKG